MSTGFDPTFVEAAASGNTFLICDLRQESRFSGEDRKKRLQRELIASGRDSLLILTCPDRDDRSLIKMWVLERDGSFSDYCGNGARSVCDYLRRTGGAAPGTPIRFVSRRGIHRTRLDRPGEIGIEMLTPLLDITTSRYFDNLQDLEHRLLSTGLYETQIAGCAFQFVDSSEPHLIAWDSLTEAQHTKLAKAINLDRKRFPFGMNVSSAQRVSDASVRLQTYERGLNRFTAACGTGATAAAYAHRLATADGPREIWAFSRGGGLRVEISASLKSVWLWGRRESLAPVEAEWPDAIRASR